MSLINNLIRVARQVPAPAELMIKPTDVGSVAAHFRACTSGIVPDDLEDQIRAGKLEMLGIPIRVLGQGRAA